MSSYHMIGKIQEVWHYEVLAMIRANQSFHILCSRILIYETNIQSISKPSEIEMDTSYFTVTWLLG